jgi:C1A family cysteine protease
MKSYFCVMMGVCCASLNAQVSLSAEELKATAPVQQQLMKARKTISDQKLTFSVGITSVSNKPLQKLVGEKQLNVAQEGQFEQRIQTHIRTMNATLPPAAAQGEGTSPHGNVSQRRFDLRTTNNSTPVKDQGETGTCWAFGAVSAYESDYRVTNTQTIDAAEQQVINCSGAGDENGGLALDVFTWMVNTRSNLVDEGTAPYQGIKLTCSTTPATAYKATAYGVIDPSGNPSRIASVAAIKKALVRYGAISASVLATDLFQFYTTGVFNEIPSDYNTPSTNHAITLIGWDDDKNAWILKNSWGTNWGNTCDYGTSKGYMYINYNSNNIGRRAAWILATPAAVYDVSANNYNFLTGDFNGDGKTDLVHLVNNNYLHTWNSRGDGTFDIKNRFPAQNGYALNTTAGYRFLVGDFNGDGKSDLFHIVNNDYSNTWLSRGDGTFDIKNRFPAQNGYAMQNTANYHFIVGDFNGDGKSDLIHIVNNDYSHVWISRGDGTFEVKNRFPAQNTYALNNTAGYRFLAGDFNGDGKTDLMHIVNNDYSHVWLSRGDGTFDIKNRFPAQNGYAMQNTANYNFTVGDFNGDGKMDLIHIVNNDYSHVWISRGDGTFDIKNRFPAQNTYAMNNVAGYRFLPGDFNGDGKTDLVHIVNNNYSHTWLSRGDGTFEIQGRFPVQNDYDMKNAGNYKFLTGKFNNDTRFDLIHVVNNRYTHVWGSQGNGTYQIYAPFPQ